MARGYKTGGRQRGTPNRASRDVSERLQALGCDPVAGMARLAMDAGNSAELRLRAYAELAAYCFPRLRAIEVKPDVELAPRPPPRRITLEEAERSYKNMKREVELRLQHEDPMTEEDARNAYFEAIRRR
jgi:hypothetical protein